MALIAQALVRNRLLAGLPADAYAVLQPNLERRSLDLGAQVEAPSETIAHVHFPEPGVVSLVARTAGGVRLEAGVIGPEGMTGLPLLHGLARTPHESFVQVPCRTLCLTAEAFTAALRAHRPLHDRLLRYAHAFSVQIAQTALANGRFTIGERLARWLLMCHDRSDREDLPLTHEFLSLMLGVRRAGVTTALQVLQGAGAIRNRRSMVAIHDRAVLIEAAGESYGPAEAAYAQAMDA